MHQKEIRPLDLLTSQPCLEFLNELGHMPLHGNRSQIVLTTTELPGASLDSLSPLGGCILGGHVYYVTKIKSSALHKACQRKQKMTRAVSKLKCLLKGATSWGDLSSSAMSSAALD